MEVTCGPVVPRMFVRDESLLLSENDALRNLAQGLQLRVELLEATLDKEKGRRLELARKLRDLRAASRTSQA